MADCPLSETDLSAVHLMLQSTYLYHSSMLANLTAHLESDYPFLHLTGTILESDLTAGQLYVLMCNYVQHLITMVVLR